MKKTRSLLMVVMLTLISVFTMVACNNANSLSAKFTQESFELSLNDTINFFDYLTFENVEKEKVILGFGDESLFTKNEDGSFNAIKSGNTVVKVIHEDNLLTAANVTVKQKFSLPIKINVDEFGVVSWQESSAYFENAIVKAKEYLVKVNGQDFRVQGNRYTLTEKGGYTFQVKAIGVNGVDDSDFSETVTIDYGVMKKVEITDFIVSDEFNNQKAELVWNIVAGAHYNVYLDGFKVFDEIFENRCELNFTNFYEGQKVDVVVEAVDRTGKLISSKTIISVQKIPRPNLSYKFQDGQGKAVWNDNDKVTSYTIKCLDRNNPSNITILHAKAGDVESALEGLASGIYTVSLQANGGENENGYFVNSNSDSKEFAKLSTPNVLHSMTNEVLSLRLPQDSYIENYAISYNNKINLWNVKEKGYDVSISLSEFSKGKHEVGVSALPTLEGDNIKDFVDGNFVSNRVLNSNTVLIDIYLMEDIESINHSIVEGSSIISFDSVEHATSYTAKVGGKIYEDYQEIEGIVYFNLGDISSIVIPENNKVKIEISVGRVEGYTIPSFAEKNLTILNKPSEDETQENGYYSWQSVVGCVQYRYEIYDVDKDFALGDAIEKEPIVNKETSELRIEDSLEFGYYYIRVYSVSTDENQYLNSDFHDSKGYLQAIFHVEKQIETPTAEFNYNETTGGYYLTINKVSYAEKYEIEINGEVEGVVFDYNLSNTEAKLTYNFTSKFSEAGVYVIKVKAEAGSAFDEVLHTPSKQIELTVNKLEAPTFEVDDEELLTVKMIDNVSSVTIKEDQEQLNETGSSTISLAQRNGQFDLVMQYIATPSKDNIYYLNSNETLYHFKRASQPTNITFTSGNLTFECEDDEYIEKYIGTISLINESNGNYTINFEITDLTFNLQAFIQTKMLEDVRFESAYKQCSSVEVMVSAYKHGFVNVGGNEIYYLPSANGTTSLGQDKLTLTQLEAPKITYDTSTYTLSWNGVGNIGQTTYSIYVNGQLVKDNLAGTSYIINTAAENVYVFANNPAYLSSANSNAISITKLQSVSRVGVINESKLIHFTLPAADLTHVESVLCNGDEVAFNSSNGYVSINIDGTDKISLSLVAGKEYTSKGVTYYFINSDVSEYILGKIDDLVITLNVKEGVLEWNDIATDFAGVENRPLSYNIAITQNGVIVEKITNLNENKYSLDAEILYKLMTGDYSIQVEAVISDYYMDSNNNTAKGYYGQLSSNVLNVKKLEQIGQTSFASVEDESISKLTERKINSKIKLTWDNIWKDSINVSFNISINETTKLNNIKAGDIDQNYTLSLDGDMYILILHNRYFQNGINKLIFTVNADAAITSNNFEYQLRRYNTVNSLEISDDGLLTITADENIDSFLIGVLIGGNIYYKETNLREYNIMEGLLDKASGNYTVEVVGFDSQGKALPSIRVASINGYRLNGISNVSILDDGDVNIALYSEAEIDDDISFVAKFNSSIIKFSPARVDNSNIFTYSMLELIKLFGITSESEVNIFISVQKSGNINADWVALGFDYKLELANSIEYKRGLNYVDDYLIFSHIEGTTAFRFTLTYTMTDSNIPVTVVHKYTAANLHGYWITNSKGEQTFVKELPTTGVESSVECFGISLKSLLSDISGGDIEIKISRVQKLQNGDVVEFSQYNEIQFTCQKLTSVTGLRISSNRVTWNASTALDAEYYVYFYTQENNEYKLNFYRHVTTAFIDVYNQLTPGVRYYINVITVSPTLRQIASNATLNVEAFKYKEPSMLEIVDGRIMFNRDKVQSSDLFKSIKENFNLKNVTPNDIVKNIATANYDNIYTFTPANINSIMVELNFHSLTNGRNYSAKVKAIDLMPDISKYTFETNQGTNITYLQALYDAARQATEQYTYRIDVERMFNAFKNANGIADFETLFDMFGLNIPAGDYELSLSQVGIDNVGTISSHPTEIVKVYVAAAPNINLTWDDANGRNEYKVEFTPTLTRSTIDSELSIAGSYIMSMVSKDGNNQYFFNIVNNGTIENPIYEMIGVIQPLTDEYGKVAYKTTMFEEPIRLEYKNDKVVINITTNLLPVMPDIARTTYDFTIFAQGGDFTINSKTDMVTLTLLGINAASITIDNGVLSWSASGSTDFKTRVTYKKEGEGVNFVDVDFDKGEARLELPTHGKYEYLVLSILGGVGVNSMTVDSEAYLIENIYKLIAPSVSTKGNVFTITNQSKNRNFYDYTQFEIDNNVAREGSEKINPYLTSLSSNMQYTYWAGQLGVNDKYKATEQYADKFYISSVGNSTEFNPSERLDSESIHYGRADFVLVPKSEITYCVLNSTEVEASAKMLNNPTNVEVLRGDIVWTAAIDETENNLPENVTVLYEIALNYYKHKEGSDYEMVGSTTYFYTTKTTFDTINIVARDDSEYYIFEIKALTFLPGNERDYDIKTIEGDYFKRASIEYLDGGAVLGSELALLGSHTNNIKKVKPIQNPKIVNGEFTWQTSEANNGYECVVVDENGIVVPGVVTGKGTTAWGFIADVAYENNPYMFRVYVYDTLSTALKSNPVTVTLGGSSEVRILPQVTSEDFVIEKVDNGYQVNLENLYLNKQIFDTDIYYNVRMTVTLNGTETLTADSYQNGSNRNFILTSADEFSVNGHIVNLPIRYDSLSIKFQVVVRGEVSQSVMLLNGKESDVFELTPLGWSVNDKLSWNEEIYQFEWTYENQEDDNQPLFNIDIEYTTGLHEKTDVYGFSYKPRQVGDIVGVKLLVRNDANSLYSTTALELKTVTPQNPLKFWLFDGGNGRQENPYLISSAVQFENIKYRNSSTEKYYYRQNASLEIESVGIYFNDTFFGSYDGNGFGISLTGKSEEIEPINQSFFANTTSSSTNISFDRGATLFKGLGAGSEVFNLKLELKFVSTGTTENTLFAGIAFTNYGRIENVQITAVNNQFSFGRIGNIAIAECGLVVTNYGRIIECENKADVYMVATASYNYSFIVAGLVLTNSTSGNNFTGTLTRCFNQGNITVSASRPNSTVWASGLALNNIGGKLIQCGNDGNVSSGESGANGITSYLSGVVLRSMDGEIGYTYNNGTIKAGTKDTSYIGGIAYSISGGKISSLVETSHNYIAKICVNRVNNINKSYCYSSYLTSGIDTLAIKAEVISCGDGHSLTIAPNGDQFIATIS